MSLQYASQQDNNDGLWLGFLKWLGLGDALDIREEDVAPENTLIFTGGQYIESGKSLVADPKYPRCQEVCPLAQQLQDQVRSASAERAQSKIFCLEKSLQKSHRSRNAKETMSLVKDLFRVAKQSQKEKYQLTPVQKKLIADIEAIHTKNIRKLL